MAARIQALAAVVRDTYGGDASAIWRDASTGTELVTRLKALPGFGEQKARIFTALLGKQARCPAAGLGAGLWRLRRGRGRLPLGRRRR